MIRFILFFYLLHFRKMISFLSPNNGRYFSEKNTKLLITKEQTFVSKILVFRLYKVSLHLSPESVDIQKQSRDER